MTDSAVHLAVFDLATASLPLADAALRERAI